MPILNKYMYERFFIRRLVFVSIFFGLLLNIFAEDAALNFGGKFGWNNVLSSSNIKIINGKFGNSSIMLSSSPVNTSTKTDMYISFDFDEPVDEIGSYVLQEYSIMKTDSQKAKLGEGAGLCVHHSKKSAVRLKPMKDSFFAGNATLKSFTIEFWLYPHATENGNIILKWWASLIEKKKTKYQNIIASVFNNKLEWSFLNIWQAQDKTGLDIKLLGRSNLIPETWSHHLITYNDETGLLEYRMNGKTEDIIYLTKTGKENANVLYAMLGSPADVLIAPDYSGLIDELKVIKQFFEPNMPWEISSIFEKYPKAGGKVETNIIDCVGKKSEALKLNADFVKPEQTDVEFFIRSADSPFNWTASNPEWVVVRPNEKIENVTGRYFQLACSLYPDASCQNSPVVHSISLQYDKDITPLPPTKIFAKALDGSVELSWSPSVNFDAKGYLIYFGENKGEYLSPYSPIDVGNVLKYKIEKLQNGKIYFFAIASYDEDNGEHAGNFSKEVWARPLKSKKE